ncbi:MAG: hypothetical protein KDA58_03130 [Planctomycetaceae bacterium]|nr:hypothetical protein [Planctomycetaceae bacterium]
MALAILVVGGCLALVVDSLWLKVAHRELQTAADAAVLGAAGELASDARLSADYDTQELATAVRQQAAHVAAGNTAGGQSVRIDSLVEGDVHLGKIVTDSNGLDVFLETDVQPTSVVLFAHCRRQYGNPVPLFFPQFTGQPAADLTCRAEASIDPHVVGVRPLDQANVPALPLAVMELHSDPRRLDTWAVQIEARRGRDQYRFNAETGEVELGSDGIPEIVLHSTERGSEEEEEKRGNVQLVDLGTGLRVMELDRQIHHGWNWRDLQEYGSEFRLDQGTVRLQGTERIEGPLVDDLRDMIGHSRIVLLYRAAGPAGADGLTHAEISRFAAGRIMDVRPSERTLELVLQPAVVATRTALTADSSATNTATNTNSPNPYLYRLSLTY